MSFFDRVEGTDHWSVRLARVLFACWFVLVPCLLLPFILEKAGLSDEFTEAVALLSLALSFYVALLWLCLFLMAVVSRRGKLNWYLWLQAISLLGSELFVGSVIAHP